MWPDRGNYPDAHPITSYDVDVANDVPPQDQPVLVGARAKVVSLDITGAGCVALLDDGSRVRGGTLDRLVVAAGVMSLEWVGERCGAICGCGGECARAAQHSDECMCAPTWDCGEDGCQA
jgi:hypothetical protein